MPQLIFQLFTKIHYFYFPFPCCYRIHPKSFPDLVIYIGPPSKFHKALILNALATFENNNSRDHLSWTIIFINLIKVIKKVEIKLYLGQPVIGQTTQRGIYPLYI